MTNVIGYALLVLGVVVFGIGYVRNRRNLMLVGTIMLFIGAGFSDMVRGFLDGLNAAGR